MITAINWTIATNENLGIVDSKHVYKNIYEMSLSEFLRWCMEDVKEVVVSIEKKEK